ncbi:CYFA0S03e02960g1_1 [Cyberlindnera fabianii]|uniref:Transcription elongation factor SPT5 n=1 Tax=Cyberlindnera fabianii TaxID=36022 RepID=A0A061AP69_CYBFA|nr:CYFA0S03e02960g1_1 [Cyberlindnera fabianii]
MSDDREFEHEENREEMREMEDANREEEDDAVDEAEAETNSNDVDDNAIVEEGEDDDDDDEDDEDEEEDRVRSRKRARRDRNQFLDVEAEVSDDDEDDEEDDDDLAREGFIAADHEHDAEEAGARDDRLHRQVDRNREKNTEVDAQRLAASFKQKYGKSSTYRPEESGNVSQRFLLPSINDPSIWAVRCRPTKEKEIVKKLLQRKLTLEGKPNALKILSAFQRDNFTGYIYIEAEKLNAVDVAIRGFADVYPNNKVLVPVEEFPDLLRPSKSSEVKVTGGSYVRIKRGKYKGDLAIVDNVEENGLEMTLQIVPRLDYKGLDVDETGKRKRATSKFRPPQRLFSKKDALEFDPHNIVVRSNNAYTYKGEDYIDGFLYKLFKLQHLETQNVQPTLEEISRFNTGDSEDLDLTSIAQSLKNTKSLTFNAGDRVQVLQGEQKGLQGDVVSASNDIVIIKPRNFKGNNMEFPLSNLRKIFNEGDHVSVLRGKHAGHTGIVVSIDEDQVTFISDQSHKDVSVFANTLTKSDDSSTLVDSKYDLHELVRINATTVGVIIGADQDVYTVLSQDGKVLSLPPSAITEKVQVGRDQSFSTDSRGEAIKVTDMVREDSGFKRSGVVLHIYRSFVFVYSKETAENNGVFVSDNMSISNVASKQGSIDKKESLDLTKMNPKFRNGGQMAPPPVPTKFTGRDRTLNQPVSIRLGEYKGYRGIVKDTNGDIARVELHTKNKILSISKTKLAFIDKNGRLVPYEEFISSRDNFNSSIPGFSNAGSSASAASGQNSSWSTPSVGGRTPAWSNQKSGGRTQYGSNSFGNATQYGAATAYAGGTEYAGAGNGTAYGGGTAWGAGGGTSYGSANDGAGTAWGAGGGNTAWGGNTAAHGTWGGQSQRAGGASQHRGSQWGGHQSTHAQQQGAGWGGATGHGNRTGYGNNTNHGGTQYGGQSAWGARSSHQQNWNQQQGYNAKTPGQYQEAQTPGGYQ